MTEATVRAFVAVPLPEETRVQLGCLQRRLEEAAGGSGVRWVASEGLHITLKFLGAVPTLQVEEIAEALRLGLQGVAPFTLWLSALGAFPTLGRPRILWVGATGAVDRLADLQRRVERELTALHFPAETRPFSPHITLGRVRDGLPGGFSRHLGEAIRAQVVPPDLPPAPVEEVILYQSTLTRAGAVYSSLAVVRLEAG